MPIIKNIEGHWFKLDKTRPAAAFGDSGPKWEFQAVIRTKTQADELKALGFKLTPTEENGKVIYKISFRKPTHKKNGEPNLPVKVLDGKLNEIDPKTIGNGSVVNIEIFAYDYEVKSQDGKSSKKGKAFMLMKVQVVKLKLFVPRQGESFDMVDTEVIQPADEQDNESMSGDGEGSPSLDDAAGDF